MSSHFHFFPKVVIPTKVGIQIELNLDPHVRGDDTFFGTRLYLPKKELPTSAGSFCMESMGNPCF